MIWWTRQKPNSALLLKYNLSKPVISSVDSDMQYRIKNKPGVKSSDNGSHGPGSTSCCQSSHTASNDQNLLTWNSLRWPLQWFSRLKLAQIHSHLTQIRSIYRKTHMHTTHLCRWHFASCCDLSSEKATKTVSCQNNCLVPEMREKHETGNDRKKCISISKTCPIWTLGNLVLIFEYTWRWARYMTTSCVYTINAKQTH